MKTTSRKSRTDEDKKKGNKKAILGRLKHRSDVQANAQNRHDLRSGQQPKYVDRTRSPLNDVLIAPLGGAELNKICTARRDKRGLTKRAKKDGKVATTGLLAFGVEAQVWFEELDRATQNRAFLTIAEAICSRCNTTLTGLIVHRDESAVHAHFQMPSYDINGDPLTKTMTWSDYTRLQDLVAEVIKQFEPRIERGNRKWDRIAAGADPSETINRSVKRLHVDLPLEIEEEELLLGNVQAERNDVQAELDGLRASVAALFAQREKVQQRILRLQEQEALTEQKEKNLRLYEGRLAKHAADYDAAVVALNLRESALHAEKAKIDHIREEAERQAAHTIARAVEQQGTLLEGVQLIWNGELCIEDGRWTAPTVGPEVRVRLNPLLQYLRPIYDKLAGLLAKLTREREALAHERKTVALERARAGEVISELEAVRSQLSTVQAAKLDQVRDELDLTP